MRLQTIPRPSRLRAVWLAYWTLLRWWSWPLCVGLCVLGIWGGSEVWKPKTHNLPTLGHKQITEVGADGQEVVRYESTIEKETPTVIFSSGLPSTPAPTPAAHVHLRDGGIVQGKEPKWDKLRSLTLDRGWASCQPLWTPGAMPLLESLVVWDQVQDQSIVQLCELYDLKALTLVHAGELTATAMECLAQEPRLEFLSLDVDPTWFHSTLVPGELPETLRQRELKLLQSLRHAPLLTWPASLKTLYYTDFQGVNPARLNEWQRLPELRCLATQLTPDAEHRLSEEAITSLKQFPKLKQLYLREPAQNESDLAIIQQQRLPHLNVRPWSYDPTRGRRAGVLLVGGLIVAMALHIQLFKQFASASNGLKPSFTLPHLMFAAGVIAAMAITSCLFYWSADCSWHAALGMCGAAVLLLAADLKFFRLVLGRYSTMLLNNVGLQAQFVIVMVMAITALVSIFGAEIDWFLRGQFPWVSVCLLVAALWGACDWATWLIGMSRDLEETGCANVPLGTFDQKGWTEWHKHVAAVKTTGREKPPLWMRRQERRLDRMVRDVAAGKKFTPLEMWRLAVPMTWLDFAFSMITVLAAVLIPLSVLAYYLEGQSFEGANKLSWPLGVQLIFMGLIVPMAQLAQRYPMLSLERLRPATRADWTKTWFRGVCWELAPVALLMFCGMLALHLTGWVFGQTIFESVIAFTAIMGAGGVIVSFGMFSMTLRTRWWLVAFASVVGTGVGMASLVGEFNLQAMSSDPTPVSWAIGVLYVAAIGLWKLAQWRWREWELGLLEQ